MNHLSQEDLILSYYGDLEPQARVELSAHLDACGECREELARLATVLDQVRAIEVPEPEEGFEAKVWDRLSWKLEAEERRSRLSRRAGLPVRHKRAWFAAAAMIALAFVTGVLVTRREVTPATVVTAAKPQPAAATPAAASTQQQRDRILLVVVGDHFDESERVLVELANLTPTSKDDTDITTERRRAEELLASNRLYRRTALDRGEENVATLLDELEPVLMQIAHSPSQLSSDELRRIQKRVEAKGLVFKLRVVRAGVRQETDIPQQPTI